MVKQSLRERCKVPTPGPVCGVRILLEGLPPRERHEVVEVLADPSIASSVLARVLAEDDSRVSRVSADTVRRHRRGDCSCAVAR